MGCAPSRPDAPYAAAAAAHVRNHADGNNAELLAILRKVRTLSFPMAVLPATIFRELGAMRSHEEVRAQLVYFDNNSALARRAKPVIFLSHEWETSAAPDPDNRQYLLMVQAIDVIVADRGWRLDDVHVWLDYFSVPQANDTCKSLAIHSIVLYASNADAFCACAPLASRVETGQTLNTLSWARRMWCRAECMLFLLQNEDSRMWLATDDGTFSDGAPTPNAPIVQRMPEAFVSTSSCAHVFSGEATVAADKLELMPPLLAMYGALVASTIHAENHLHHLPLAQRAAAHERRALRERQRKIFSLIQAERDVIFPPFTTLPQAAGGAPKRVRLFGDLCDRIEAAAEIARKELLLSDASEIVAQQHACSPKDKPPASPAYDLSLNSAPKRLNDALDSLVRAAEDHGDDISFVTRKPSRREQAGKPRKAPATGVPFFLDVT